MIQRHRVVEVRPHRFGAVDLEHNCAEACQRVIVLLCSGRHGQGGPEQAGYSGKSRMA
jgi:hypothetical protein